MFLSIILLGAVAPIILIGICLSGCDSSNDRFFGGEISDSSDDETEEEHEAERVPSRDEPLGISSRDEPLGMASRHEAKRMASRHETESVPSRDEPLGVSHRNKPGRIIRISTMRPHQEQEEHNADNLKKIVCDEFDDLYVIV